jgi:sarcosine oxidase subunit beta
MADLPSTADVVVVGGGVIGASTLYHLAKAGCTNTVLIERDTIAAGSTSKAAGGIRAQFSDELNIRMALENIGRFARFEGEFGVDIDFRQWGYLFLITADHLPSFEANVALQRRLGVPVELLEPEAALDIVPQLSLDGIVAATFCPIDGHATPETVAQTYATAARQLGATVVQGCEVLAIDVDGDRVSAVTTTRGTVQAESVVCAAGAWSAPLLHDIGVDLPVTPEKRYVWMTNAEDPLPHELPLTVDFATSFWFQREGRRIMLGARVDTLGELAPHATRRLPLLAGMEIKPGWWGYYTNSPDHNAIIDAAASPQGLYYATGFSGHGFQQSPVVGEYLADIALGREPAFDLSPLSLQRFDSADVKGEANVI